MLKIINIIVLISLLISFNAYAGQEDVQSVSDNNTDVQEVAVETAGIPDPPRKVADPLKYFNWGMYYLNDGLHTVVVNPVTVVISYILPRFLRTGINNAVNNIVSVVSIPNNLLQFKFKNTGTETLRFLTNSTIGLAGLIEVAEPLFGLEPKSEDFGQTFGYWGIHEGFFLNLPLLGMTTLRGLPGSLVTDSYDAIGTHRGKELGPMRYSNGWFGTSFIAGSLKLGQYKKAKDLAKENDIAPYIFLREAWCKQGYAKEIE